MNFPNELKYTKHDEWVKMIDDTTALVGQIILEQLPVIPQPPQIALPASSKAKPEERS